MHEVKCTVELMKPYFQTHFNHIFFPAEVDDSATPFVWGVNTVLSEK